MLAVLQRVKAAAVAVEGRTVAQTAMGLAVLLGVCEGDGEEQADLLAEKTAGLRIFSDDNDKMNRSLIDVQGEALVVSNFTLCADCSHGRRPSFMAAKRPGEAEALYLRYASRLKGLGVPVQTGVFGADMQLSLTCDGPVTILLNTDDWKKKS